MQRLIPMLVLGLLCQSTVTLIAQDAEEILEQEQAALTTAVNRAEHRANRDNRRS